jgi:hypothetical protein
MEEVNPFAPPRICINDEESVHTTFALVPGAGMPAQENTDEEGKLIDACEDGHSAAGAADDEPPPYDPVPLQWDITAVCAPLICSAIIATAAYLLWHVFGQPTTGSQPSPSSKGGYYAGVASLTGLALKHELTQLLETRHQPVSYQDLWTDLPRVDGGRTCVQDRYSNVSHLSQSNCPSLGIVSAVLLAADETVQSKPASLFGWAMLQPGALLAEFLVEQRLSCWVVERIPSVYRHAPDLPCRWQGEPRARELATRHCEHLSTPLHEFKWVYDRHLYAGPKWKVF